MPIIRHHQLRDIETPGGNTGAALATPSRGATQVSVIRQRQQPGGANPLHTHDREEVLVMLAGEITIMLDGEAHAIAAGDTVIIPPRTPHHLANTGAATAEWLLIAPAGVRFTHADGAEGSPPWAQ
ncbi:MAG: cupin domain-containing protein [Thermomicrobiales bacterium]